MRIEYFLGVGQSKKSAHWLKQESPDISFHTAPNYLRHSTHEAMADVGRTAVARHLTAAGPYIVFAESQAAPAVVAAIERSHARLPDRLVLLQPLGLNRDALGATPVSRRKELYRRSRIFWGQKSQSLSIRGNRWTLMTLVLQSLRYICNLNNAYEIGASMDITRDLTKVAEKMPVEIFATSDDSLFPFDELKQVKGATMHRLSGTHLNRATPLGAQQLKAVLGQIRYE